MTLVAEIMEAMAGHVRKGGKAHRKLQRARLLKFAVFAQNRGQWSAEQVGGKDLCRLLRGGGLVLEDAAGLQAGVADLSGQEESSQTTGLQSNRLGPCLRKSSRSRLMASSSSGVSHSSTFLRPLLFWASR